MSSGTAIQQQTLTGETADDVELEQPKTFLYCDECEEPILRSRRFEHEHDLDDATAYTKAQRRELEEKVPDHALVDTQTWEVTFHYEVVETVTVEAPSKAEAKEEASHYQTYNGEYMETIHTERRSVSEPSQASIDWLETHNLLPDDHDVTAEDLEAFLDD